MKTPDWQGMADREARQIIRKAYKYGGSVPYSLARLIELGTSLKVIRAVYRGGYGQGSQTRHRIRPRSIKPGGNAGKELATGTGLAQP